MFTGAVSLWDAIKCSLSKSLFPGRNNHHPFFFQIWQHFGVPPLWSPGCVGFDLLYRRYGSPVFLEGSCLGHIACSECSSICLHTGGNPAAFLAYRDHVVFSKTDHIFSSMVMTSGNNSRSRLAFLSSFSAYVVVHRGRHTTVLRVLSRTCTLSLAKPCINICPIYTPTPPSSARVLYPYYLTIWMPSPSPLSSLGCSRTVLLLVFLPSLFAGSGERGDVSLTEGTDSSDL